VLALSPARFWTDERSPCVLGLRPQTLWGPHYLQAARAAYEFAFTFQRMLTMAEIVAKATPPTAIKYPNREETRRAIFDSVKLRSLPQ
jgi:hypothetical protein